MRVITFSKIFSLPPYPSTHLTSANLFQWTAVNRSEIDSCQVSSYRRWSSSGYCAPNCGGLRGGRFVGKRLDKRKIWVWLKTMWWLQVCLSCATELHWLTAFMNNYILMLKIRVKVFHFMNVDRDWLFMVIIKNGRHLFLSNAIAWPC